MTTIEITTVQVGPCAIFGQFPGIQTPIGQTLGSLSPSQQATVAEGRLAGFSPVLVIDLDTNEPSIEMR